MKITFIQSHYENLGVEYLSSCLKQNGHEVSLLFEPALFDSFFLKHNRLSQICSYQEYILNKISENKPDLIAFSVISDCYPWVKNLTQKIKQRFKIPILYGGIHPTAVPEKTLNDCQVDYIIMGEAEEAIVELTDHLQNNHDISKIDNLCFRKNGLILKNRIRPPIKNLDDIPFPDKQLFFNEYQPLVKKSYMIVASRGCNNSCSYCINSFLNKTYPDLKYSRRRSPDNVIKELEWAQKLYDIKSVTFYDEIFTYDRTWLKEFLNEYEKRVAKPFFCCMYPSDIDPSLVYALADAGCFAVNIGIQTYSEKIRRQILLRSGKNDEIRNCIRLLKDAGIYIYSNIMLGLPTQTEEELIDTWKFCHELSPDMASIYWLRYYPGTQIIDIARKCGNLSDDKILQIEAGELCSPYAINGSTYNNKFAKIGNGILLSCILPDFFSGFIIKHKLHRYLPGRNMLFLTMILSAFLNKFKNNRKKTFHYLDVLDYAKYYAHYIFKILRFYLNRKNQKILS